MTRDAWPAYRKSSDDCCYCCYYSYSCPVPASFVICLECENPIRLRWVPTEVCCYCRRSYVFSVVAVAALVMTWLRWWCLVGSDTIKNLTVGTQYVLAIRQTIEFFRNITSTLRKIWRTDQPTVPTECVSSDPRRFSKVPIATSITGAAGCCWCDSAAAAAATFWRLWYVLLLVVSLVLENGGQVRLATVKITLVATKQVIQMPQL